MVFTICNNFLLNIQYTDSEHPSQHCLHMSHKKDARETQCVVLKFNRFFLFLILFSILILGRNSFIGLRRIGRTSSCASIYCPHIFS